MNKMWTVLVALWALSACEAAKNGGGAPAGGNGNDGGTISGNDATTDSGPAVDGGSGATDASVMDAGPAPDLPVPAPDVPVTAKLCAANGDCAKSQFCAKASGQCDQKGECKAIPTTCPSKRYSPGTA